MKGKAPTAASREKAQRWMREQAQKLSQEQGKSAGATDRNMAEMLREGDARERETGSR